MCRLCALFLRGCFRCINTIYSNLAPSPKILHPMEAAIELQPTNFQLYIYFSFSSSKSLYFVAIIIYFSLNIYMVWYNMPIHHFYIIKMNIIPLFWIMNTKIYVKWIILCDLIHFSRFHLFDVNLAHLSNKLLKFEIILIIRKILNFFIKGLYIVKS